MLERTSAEQWFTGLTLFTLMVLAAAIVLVTTNHTVGRNARSAFLGNLIALTLIVAADWINIVAAHGISEMRTFQIVSTSFTFAVAPILPVIIANTIFPERYARVVLVVLAIHAVFELCNIFYPLVFSVDATNAYSRGSLYWVYMCSYCISSVYLTVESIKASTTYQAASTVSVVTILLCMLGGVAIQFSNPGLRMSWPAVVIAVVLYFQFYTEMTLRTDALTMLLNRHGYEEFLAHPPLPCTIVLIDVDNFKQVNDTYGHAYGDVALRTLARVVRKRFGNAGLCYRIGGDEFAVIVTKKDDDIESLIATLYNAVSAERAADAQLPGISVGFARADAGSSIRDIIKQADSAMYENKRARKARAAV